MATEITKEPVAQQLVRRIIAAIIIKPMQAIIVRKHLRRHSLSFLELLLLQSPQELQQFLVP